MPPYFPPGTCASLAMPCLWWSPGFTSPCSPDPGNHGQDPPQLKSQQWLPIAFMVYTHPASVSGQFWMSWPQSHSPLCSIPAVTHTCAGQDPSSSPSLRGPWGSSCSASPKKAALSLTPLLNFPDARALEACQSLGQHPRQGEGQQATSHHPHTIPSDMSLPIGLLTL